MRRSSHRRSHISRRQVWCDRDDCRHLDVSIGGIELHNFYVPAGGDVPDPEQNPKFAHKLQFLGEMAAWARTDGLASRKAIVVGDLNRSEAHTSEHQSLMRKSSAAFCLITKNQR